MTRSLLLLLAFAAALRAEDLVDAVRKFDPAARPKGKVEKDIEAEALRKATSRYGPHAKEHLGPLLAEGMLEWRRRQLAERTKANLDAVEAEGAPDHGTATKFLCDLFVISEARSSDIEERRADLEKQIANTGGPGDGTGPLVQDRMLLREYADHLVDLRAGCVRLLAQKKEPDSERYLTSSALPHAPSPLLRVQIARILAPRPDMTPGYFLAVAAKEKDDSVRAGILAALGSKGAAAAGSVPEIAAMLSDSSERVRMAIAHTLSRIRAPECVEPLVQDIAKETGRARHDVARALEELTGERFGPLADVWARWWEEHKGEILNQGLPPLGGAKAADDTPDRWKGEGGFYYGIPQVSERVLYIVDVSDSMRFSMEGQTRLDRCKAEIVRAIDALPRGATFGVIAFSADVRPWKDEMVRATDSNRDAAKGWISDLRVRTSTNIYDALREAFRMAGEGTTKKNSKALIDTIYLLSDGAPTLPDANLDNVDRILAAAREWNALGRVRIHTIGIGKGLKFTFLERLAEEHDGHFVQKDW